MTAGRLAEAPTSGETHRWLAQVASGLRGTLAPEACFKFLRRCCDEFVAHREVPDREIGAAVELAHGDVTANGPAGGANFGRRAIAWPEASERVIRKVLDTVEPCFDGAASTGLRPCEVLPALFQPGELVCMGADSERALIRPVEEVLTEADTMQFVCVNPMRGAAALNYAGRMSVRCQNNVALRRFLVAEFDDATISKREQAQLATALGQMAPLVMAVDSGGKSVHAWFRVEGMPAREQAKFFAVACLLGADRTRWDMCGWLRMPGGLRVVDGRPSVRQKILYWRAA